MEKRDIKDFTLEELEKELGPFSEPKYRAGQIFYWLYQKGLSKLEEFTNLPQALRKKLDEEFRIESLELESHFKSKDRTEKFLFKLEDGSFIETVLIPERKRKTVCLSTQVGCKFGCAFCASGLNGFKSNLTASEIIGQVLFLRHRLNYGLTNFVFMGMGEPLDNFKNVARAILILNSAKGLGIAARRITLSTCGIIPGILELKNLGLQVNLSVSLHAADDKLRRKLMPVAEKYPLERLLKACEDYVQTAGRKMTLEYVLIRNVNDREEDVAGLAAIARRLWAKVNLIPYSPVCGLDYQAPPARKIDFFKKKLEQKKVSVTLRRSKGADIQAACGQLAGKRNTTSL